MKPPPFNQNFCATPKIYKKHCCNKKILDLTAFFMNGQDMELFWGIPMLITCMATKLKAWYWWYCTHRFDCVFVFQDLSYVHRHHHHHQ